MNALKYDAGDLSRLLADDIEGVVAKLAIDVKHRVGRKLECFAPWDSHHKPKLEIELHPRPGKWNEWIGGLYGDALDLVACTLGNGTKDRRAAYRWALEYLGLQGDIDQAAWERRRAQAAANAAAREAEATQALERNRRRAKAAWLRARPLAPGDVGWTYLQARGIDLRELPRMPRAVRLALTEEWWDPATGSLEHVGPALCSAMILADNSFGSLHRVWIDPSRAGEKADVDPPRKMWPESMGAAIHLWRGASGLSVRQAAEKGLKEPVVVCEGVEDGLSLALMAPELRIIAAGSLPGLLSLQPPACAERLVIAADNDWGKPQAQALLDRACARLKGEFGLRVFLARSPEGKDFNDLLRGA